MGKHRKKQVVFWGIIVALILAVTIQTVYWFGYRHGSRAMERKYLAQLATNYHDIAYLPVRNNLERRASRTVNIVDVPLIQTNR